MKKTVSYGKAFICLNGKVKKKIRTSSFYLSSTSCAFSIRSPLVLLHYPSLFHSLSLIRIYDIEAIILSDFVMLTYLAFPP